MCPNFWVWRGWPDLRPSGTTAAAAPPPPRAVTPTCSPAPDTPSLLIFPSPICCFYAVPSPIASPDLAVIFPHLFFPKKAITEGLRREYPPVEKPRGLKVNVTISARERPRPNDEVRSEKEHILFFFSLPKWLC